MTTAEAKAASSELLREHLREEWQQQLLQTEKEEGEDKQGQEADCPARAGAAAVAAGRR